MRTGGARPVRSSGRGGIEKPRGSGTARGRAKDLDASRRTKRGLQVVEEESVVIFKHRGQDQARWAFRAWGSGGDRIYRTHTQRAERERTTHLSTWQRPKQDSCLTNSSLHCFIIPLTC